VQQTADHANRLFHPVLLPKARTTATSTNAGGVNVPRHGNHAIVLGPESCSLMAGC
jgi:hypothetical protein